MLPTMDRAPRRSRQRSATRGFLRPTVSNSATRVSPRSTLTSTCFFTLSGFLVLEAGPEALVRARGAPLREDRLQEAKGQESGEHRRAPVAHERQRDAGDGHDPEVHADVDEDLEEQHPDDTAGDQRSEQVLRDGEDAQRAPDEQGVEREDERRPDEPEALPHHGEDEVRVVLGEEVATGLGRVALATPGLLAGAYGDLRLQLLVALLLRVVGRVEERREAVH